MKRCVALWHRWAHLLAFLALFGLASSAPLDAAASCSCPAMAAGHVAMTAAVHRAAPVAKHCPDCPDEPLHVSPAKYRVPELSATVQPQCHCSSGDTRAFEVPKAVAWPLQIDAIATLPSAAPAPVLLLIATRAFAPLGHDPPRACLALRLSPRAPPVW